MNYTDLRLKVRRFFRKNGKIIFLAILAFIIIFTINNILKNIEYDSEPETTYTPHVSVLDDSSSVPAKTQVQIEDFVEQYVNYCNDRDYESAWNMISTDCQNYMFGSYSSFVSYVYNKFGTTKKEYSIQNYSNTNNLYIYQIKLFEDYLATGLTNQTYQYAEEKFAIKKESDGTISVSVGNFIEKTDIKSVSENDYIKVDIKEKITKYSYELYNIKITNKTEYTLVVADNNADSEEILLNIGNENRGRQDVEDSIVLDPGESNTFTFTFTKFYDDGDTSDSVVFNAIRIIENYTGNEDTAQEEIENAIKKFSLSIPI